VRSRPDLKLFLLPARPHGGNRLRAEVVLDSHSPTPIDGVEMTLRGLERRDVGTVMAGNVAVVQYETATHVDLVGRTPAVELTPGEHRFSIVFDLPRDAAPTYKGAATSIAYELSVRVIIPWWPDRVARFAVPVGVTPRPVHPEPASFCTDAHGPQDATLYLEASVDSTTVALGEVLTGAVSLGSVAHHRIRRVELALIAIERGRSGAAEVTRYTTVIHEGAPAESAPVPFRLEFPKEATPSFKSATCELRWEVELRAVIAFGTDRTLRFPLDVVEPARERGAASAPPHPSRTPPVGRERRALIWAEVARRHGFDLDAEEERLTRSEEGVGLAVGLAPRREGGFAVVANLTFPRLGIALAVREKRGLLGDLLAGRSIATGVPAFDARFHVRGREEAQARAFLDEASCRALLLFERASADDGGCTLEGAGTAQSLEELDELCTRALTVARVLAAQARRVPPPAVMAEHAPAWRGFAALVSGRLQLGDMSIRDAVFEHRALEIATAWGDEPAPAVTTVRLFLPHDDHGPTGPRVLEGPARAAAAALEPQVKALRVEHDRLEADLPAPLADPREALPVLEGLAQLAKVLAGNVDRGPYR
jgi:hypothetical protein